MNRKKTVFELFTLVAAFTLLLAGAAYGTEQVFVELGRERLVFERELERKTENHLGRRFALDNVSVRINAVPFLDTRDIEMETERGSRLPGVPVLQEILSASEAPALRYFLRRMHVNIYLPEDFPSETLPLVRSYALDMLNLDFDRGDSIDIEMVLPPSEKGGFLLLELIKEPYVQRLAGFGLFFVFLLGPVSGYLRQARRSIEATVIRERSGLEGSAAAGAYPGAAGGGGGGSETAESSSGKYFSFITRDNFSRLRYALRDESAETVAVVCEFLPGDLSAQLIASLSPAGKKQVMKFISKVNYNSGDRIREIEEKIREKVENIVGGQESVLKLFRELDVDSQRELIDTISEEDPGLSERLNSYMLTFEDVLKMDASQLLAIMRGIGTAAAARALKDQGEEVIGELKKKLPAGTSAVLEEEIAYMPELTPQQATQARREFIKMAYEVRGEAQ